ncbi:MAG: hypothetical protein ACJAS3_002208 [Roseivirga sp.]|jgi:hypothetical protein
MKKTYTNKFWTLAAICALSFVTMACNDDDETPALPTTYTQEDQMGRPAINTVFVTSGNKDQFNVTAPSAQGGAYQAAFQTQLLALNSGYTTNALGLDAATFTGILATDVLTVSLDGTTTFFDGTNVLTGRRPTDDVISVELLLIFGGPDGSANPGLTDDNVDANDKAFLSTFPYLATPW